MPPSVNIEGLVKAESLSVSVALYECCVAKKACAVVEQFDMPSVVGSSTWQAGPLLFRCRRSAAHILQPHPFRQQGRLHRADHGESAGQAERAQCGVRVTESICLSPLNELPHPASPLWSARHGAIMCIPSSNQKGYYHRKQADVY